MELVRKKREFTSNSMFLKDKVRITDSRCACWKRSCCESVRRNQQANRPEEKPRILSSPTDGQACKHHSVCFQNVLHFSVQNEAHHLTLASVLSFPTDAATRVLSPCSPSGPFCPAFWRCAPLPGSLPSRSGQFWDSAPENSSIYDTQTGSHSVFLSFTLRSLPSSPRAAASPPLVMVLPCGMMGDGVRF